MIVSAGAVWVTGAGEYAVWWLTSSTPPTVALEASREAVRGNVTIGVQVGPDGRAAPIEVTIDGRPLTVGNQVLVETASLPDGPHQLRVVAEDTALPETHSVASQRPSAATRTRRMK